MKITKSQLKQIIQETLEETYASQHGLEASFFSDQPGAWGETPVEHQPELEFLFSAAKGKDKEEFILANAKLLQAYDKLAASGKDREAQKVLATIKQKWTAFTKPKMKPPSPAASASKGPSLGGLSAPKSKRLSINELKQIIQEELESSLKEIAIVLGDKEELEKTGPWPVKDVSTSKKAKDEFSKLAKSVQKEEEAVDEGGPYGTSASRPAGPSYAGRTSANPTGKFYIGAPFTGVEYNTFEEAEAAAYPYDRIYDSEGNWKVKI